MWVSRNPITMTLTYSSCCLPLCCRRCLLLFACKQENNEPDLITKTKAQRIRFMSVLYNIKQKQGADAVPVVAGITFAAPRVGNAAYANAFRARSLVDPLLVREPLLESKYYSSPVSADGVPCSSCCHLYIYKRFYKTQDGGYVLY
jgi:hypothetical protein